MAKTYTEQISPLLSSWWTWNHFKRSNHRRCAPDRSLSPQSRRTCHAQRCSKGQSGYRFWQSLRIHQGLAGEWRAHSRGSCHGVLRSCFPVCRRSSDDYCDPDGELRRSSCDLSLAIVSTSCDPANPDAGPLALGLPLRSSRIELRSLECQARKPGSNGLLWSAANSSTTVDQS